MVADAPTTIPELAADLLSRDCARIHVLAWRDLDDADAGGSEVHADQFMRRWAAAGLDVTHLTSEAIGLPRHAVRNGYRVERIGSRYSVFPRTVVREVRRRRRIDALVEIWNGVPWMGPCWFRGPRIMFLHHVHGPMWDQIMPPPFAWAGRTLEARLAPPFYRSTTTLTPSGATRDELLALGFPPDRVTAVENGVEDDFQPGGLPNPTPLVVAVGRLAPVKRQDALIEAAVDARRLVPDLELVLVGEGPLRPELEAAVERHRAGDWITLTGHLDRRALVALYQRAWLVASASLAEGWGLSLTEAAACGVPAVATDINGHRSSVIDGTTGVLVQLDQLGPAIARVLADPAERERLAAGALARARTLTWEASATGVLAALHGEVVAHRAGAPRRRAPRP
jgi:glycosyltransferase involved in cell wall biosynthesis